ncbi:hypothetical protein CCMA1212_000264 [Trichoderma ghanense]|uniref:Secreted protein n=1 Tax=Trichoderma ghanense TaxID=65468 RepID=A0ABY2HJ14_9HYPO
MTLALGRIVSMLIGSQTAVWQLANQRCDISKHVATALKMDLFHQTICNRLFFLIRWLTICTRGYGI